MALAQSALEYGAVVDAAGGAVWSAGGLLLWYWVTRPVKELTLTWPGWSRTASARLSSWRPSRLSLPARMKWRSCAIPLSSWRANHLSSGIGWRQRPQRRSLSPTFRTTYAPLTSLLGYLETLSLKSATPSPQEHQQYLATALRQGQKVRHLSQQLFELARLEHGGIKPQRERFAMAELISDVAQKFELRCPHA